MFNLSALADCGQAPVKWHGDVAEGDAFFLVYALKLLDYFDFSYLGSVIGETMPASPVGRV